MPGAKWLEMLLQHVPERGEHLVRYYGWYSNRARGRRKAEVADAETPATVDDGIPEQVDPEASGAKTGCTSRNSRTEASGGAASGSRRHHQGGLRMVSCGKSGRERVVGADSGPVAWSPPAAAESKFLSLSL